MESIRAIELKDNNGYILGSSEYFRHMNENSVLGFLSSDKSNYDYEQMFKNANARLCIEVKKILSDIEKNAEYILFVPKDKRERLKDFIEGLYKFSGYGYLCSDCNKCVSFLTLYESKAKRCSNASESDIDKAVCVMYNGGKANIYSCDRLSLVEKAYKSGVSWTAGSDENKKAYLAEVMGKYNEKFLGDAFHKYVFKYNFHEKITGQNGKDMFSDDYINEHEKSIFGKQLLSNYMSSRSFDYVSFYKEKLNEVLKKINSDFDRGARGSHFVKYINWKRLQITSEILKKLGIDTTYLDINLKRFQLEDVTEKLMNIFREAKRDGEALKAKYPLAVPNMPFLTIYCKTKEDEERRKQTRYMYNDFINLVQSWAPYDIKRRYSWSEDLQYIFDGQIIDYDDTGNMAFGVIARAAGFSDFLSQLGAGVVNFIEAIEPIVLDKNGVKKDYNKVDLSETLNRELSWWRTYFDDPRDNAAIKKGFEYYEKL